MTIVAETTAITIEVMVTVIVTTISMVMVDGIKLVPSGGIKPLPLNDPAMFIRLYAKRLYVQMNEQSGPEWWNRTTVSCSTDMRSNH